MAGEVKPTAEKRAAVARPLPEGHLSRFTVRMAGLMR